MCRGPSQGGIYAAGHGGVTAQLRFVEGSPTTPACIGVRLQGARRRSTAHFGIELGRVGDDRLQGGRHTDHNVPRNVVDLNFLTERGVTCSVASNNILNPFTPFGDGQLLRQVNMHAIVTQRANDDEVKALWDMTTSSAAKLMRKEDYGIKVGGPADLVVLDAPDAITALRTVAPVLAAYKRGRRTVTREPVRLHRP